MNKRLYIFAFLLLVSALKGYGQVDFTIGSGTATNADYEYPSPYGHYYDGHRMQFLYRASDLTAAGMSAGNITGVKFNVANTNGTGPIPQWELKIGTTASTSLTGWISGLSTVATSTAYTPTSGTNTHTFSSPFSWNGTDNIVIEVCGGNSSCYIYTYNASVGYTVKSYTASYTYRADCSGNLCAATGNSQASFGVNPSWLPNITFSLIATTTCSAPSPTYSNNTSQSVKLTWPPVTGAVSYDYAVTTSSAWPTSGFTNTTALTATVTGLTPNTSYYAHVRAKCGPTTNSSWATIPFPTNPPCTKPVGLAIKKLAVDSALVSFRKLGFADGYTYVVNTDRNDPGSTTTTKDIKDTAFSVNQLQEGTKYYIHVKVKCPGGETSEWLLDSFTTLITCRPPQLKVDYQHIDRGMVHWDLVPSAVMYEYELSQSPTPLGKGTEIQKNSYLAFPLKPGEVYYFHARSKCLDQGFNNISGWNTTSFKTFPLSVSNVSKEGFVMDVYPNPVKEIVTVEIKGTPDADATVSIYDVTGKLVKAVPFGGQSKQDINMTGFAAGVYTIKYADKTHTETTRVTKQ